MNKRICPICKIDRNKSDKVFLDASYDQNKLSQESYSSRKIPEYMSYKLKECSTCSIVYASEVPNLCLSSEYNNAIFKSEGEAEDASITYFKYIKKEILSNRVTKKNINILDIGCGNGFFLNLLENDGYRLCEGIEPSIEAINNNNNNNIKIHHGLFDNIELDNKYDLITCFMTLEHIEDLNSFITKAKKILNKQGTIVFVVHNYESLLNKIFKSKSPIIDIEHYQLFNKKSISFFINKFFSNSLRIIDLKNSYNLEYWLRLFPFPIKVKKIILKFAKKSGIGRIKLSINVGNMMVIAKNE